MSTIECVALCLPCVVFGYIVLYEVRWKWSARRHPLKSRVPCDPHAYCPNGIPALEFLRIWRSLAEFYELPVDRLRLDDRLRVELSHWTGHPDKWLAFFRPELFMKPEYRVQFESCKTWGELIDCVYRCECDKKMRDRIRPDGVSE